MQFLILFPFPLPASVPCCLINTRGLCFPSQAQGLPAGSANVPGTPLVPPRRIGVAGCALGWVDVHGTGMGPVFPFPGSQRAPLISRQPLSISYH